MKRDASADLSAGDRRCSGVTVRETVFEELDRLRAQEDAQRAERRRKNLAALGARRRRQVDADMVRVEAEVILAGLPVEHPAVLAARRLVLACDGASIAVIAGELLASLPPDPEAVEHRRVLDEAARVEPVDEGWGPWRTGAEVAWSDAELRAARAAWRAGDRSPEVGEAFRALGRVERRRSRGERVSSS